MQQPPPNYPPNYTPQQQYPGQPPPPGGGNNFVKPLLIGCGALLVILLVVGGVASYFTMRAFGTAIHRASDAATVAQGAAAGVEQAAQQAQQAQASGDPNASPDPAHAAAEGVAVLKGLVGGGKAHVETLSRDELKAALPAAVDALARTQAESQSGSFSGISGTSASATYGSDAGKVNIALTDAANMAGLTSILDLATSVESEDDNGYQKNVTLGDVKVHETWVNANKHAELIGIVGGRFFVDVTGDGEDIGVDEKAFQAIDIAKLESAAAATPK